MNNAEQQVDVEELIFRPHFGKAQTFEELRDIMSLVNLDVVVDVETTDPMFLDQISILERRGLVSVKIQKKQVANQA